MPIGVKYYGTTKPGPGVNPLRIIDKVKNPFGMTKNPVNWATGKHLSLRSEDPKKHIPLWPETPPEVEAGLDLSKFRLGYAILNGRCTLKAGALNFYGKHSIAIAEFSFDMGGLQYAYVGHSRGSLSASWGVAGVEPGVSDISSLYVVYYKFLNGVIDTIYRTGDLTFDLPLV